MNSTNIMEPLTTNTMESLIKRIPGIGASVKTTRNQFLSYNYISYRNCIYPLTLTTPNGEYFVVNVPTSIYHKLLKGTPNLPINSTEDTDINLLKYIINKLY